VRADELHLGAVIAREPLQPLLVRYPRRFVDID